MSNRQWTNNTENLKCVIEHDVQIAVKMNSILPIKGWGLPTLFYSSIPSTTLHWRPCPDFIFEKKDQTHFWLFQILVLYISNDWKENDCNKKNCFYPGHGSGKQSHQLYKSPSLEMPGKLLGRDVSGQFGLVDRATNFGAVDWNCGLEKYPLVLHLWLDQKILLFKKENTQIKIKRKYEWANIFRNRKVLDLRLQDMEISEPSQIANAKLAH